MANLKNKAPIFMPQQFWRELDEKVTKAALADMVWDMAKQLTPPCDDGNEAPEDDVIGTLRHIADVILTYRKRG
jgi:hypothetical protein